MDPMLNIAIRAAYAAGDEIIRQTDRIQGLHIWQKTKNDFVSEVDHLAESIIIRNISAAYPEHSFLCEESGAQGENPYQWIIDPLDGTTNFLHGFPQFAVSIALRHNESLEQAVIYDPLRQELFSASRGRGAWLNNRRIRVSQQNSLQGALLGTGCPFREHDLLGRLDSFKALCLNAAGIRRVGAAALDLAYIGCGRLDGFWEFGLNIWDIAAGVLIIQEAGGMVDTPSGKGDLLKTGDIIAANPKLFSIMCKHLKK